MASPSGQVLAKARAVSLLLLDVDGVLTDGRVTFSSDGQEVKSFHIHDGHGIKQLSGAGIAVAILSGRESPIVARRAGELGITEVHQGVSDKLAVYEGLLARHNLRDAAVAYVGDDIPDLPVMKRVGLSVAVRNGHDAVRRSAHYTTVRTGGDGAVREVCDLLLRAKRTRPK